VGIASINSLHIGSRPHFGMAAHQVPGGPNSGSSSGAELLSRATASRAQASGSERNGRNVTRRVRRGGAVSGGLFDVAGYPCAPGPCSRTMQQPARRPGSGMSLAQENVTSYSDDENSTEERCGRRCINSAHYITHDLTSLRWRRATARQGSIRESKHGRAAAASLCLRLILMMAHVTGITILEFCIELVMEMWSFIDCGSIGVRFFGS
jgi:hypothetical protein